MEKSKKWYKSVSNWITLVLCVILIPILIINVYIMIQSKTNENKVPSIFGIKPFIVLSGSMESEIYKGDLIFTKEIEPESLKKDDVIAFRDAEKTITTHRIIDIVTKEDGTYFITKGDNNDAQDLNLVEFDDVEGIYLFRIPGIGSMMNTLSKTSTIIILVLIITFIFVISFMITNKKQMNIEKQEFLEYKRMKELEDKKKKELEDDDAIKEVKKTKSKKSSPKK